MSVCYIQYTLCVHQSKNCKEGEKEIIQLKYKTSLSTEIK